jgi:tetratricopeptide (TPR) repeat protein
MMQHVVASDPRNSEQRGVLAALSASNGSSLMKVGKPERALEYFDEARSIYESLDWAAKSVRSSANAAACREKMGEAAARTGDWDRASQYIQQALSVVESFLSAQNPDLSALYTAADGYQSLGDMEVWKARRLRQNRARQKECFTRAQAWYLKSVAVWRRIEHPCAERVGAGTKAVTQLALARLATVSA